MIVSLMGILGFEATALPSAHDVSDHSLRSKILGEHREFRVAVPRDYEAGSVSYPVIYLLDGRYNLEHSADTILHLSDRHLVPAMIVVAVHNVSREWDMTPPDLPIATLGRAGRADRFLDFFEEELIPFVESHYRCQAPRILVGHSHGGIFTSYALAERPGLFAWHLALDTPTHHHDSWLARFVTEAVRRDPGLAKRFVSVEETYGWEAAQWEAMATSASADHHLARITGLGESHESMAFLGTILGLKSLFFDYRVPAGFALTLPELTAHYGVLGDSYGAAPNVPRSQLVRHASDLLANRRGNAALRIVERAAEMYGDSLVTAALVTEAREVLSKGEPSPERELEELLKLPPPTREQAARFLGVWEGTSIHEGGVPVDLVVTFEAEGELVAGKTRSSIRGKVMGTDRHPFLRVSGAGTTIEWGEKNHRGPGMGVFVLDLQGEDELRGVKEMRGIPDGFLPDGVVLPTIHVHLRRLN
jgi:hypothetical protein